jgi:hypothetical protein
VVAKTCLSPRSIQKCSTPTLGVIKNMFVRFHQNKCSKSLIYLSQKFCCKKRHQAIIKKEKKRDDKKKREQRKNRKMRKKIAHVLAKIS